MCQARSDGASRYRSLLIGWLGNEDLIRFLRFVVGLENLRHLGVEWSPHPTDQDLPTRIRAVLEKLGSRMIELPLMTDPHPSRRWAFW